MLKCLTYDTQYSNIKRERKEKWQPCAMEETNSEIATALQICSYVYLKQAKATFRM